MASKNDIVSRIQDITGVAGVLFEDADLEPYTHDEFATDEYNVTPLAVIKPVNEREVAEIINLCSELGVPVTARGAGTGLSAGCVPCEGGIILSLEKMNKVLEIDEENLSVTVQAGVTLSQLYGAIKEAGLFFPPHPGDEGAMIGGLVAANAGGARAVKYGTIKQFIRGLHVVMADGAILNLGGNIMKSSSGYHLLDLMVGSEGTLGIITQATLSLQRPPGSMETLVIPFATIDKAIEAVNVLFKAGIIPFAVEFIEHSVISCVEKLLNKSWPAKKGAASLLVILDGPGEEEVLAQAEGVAEELATCDPLEILLAEQKERQADILELRSMIYEALRPGTGELFDICIPRSRISSHIQFLRILEDRYGISLPTYGHAGDGNIHTHSMNVTFEEGVFGDPVPGWREKHKHLRRELYADAMKRGGVISGEHGIGLVKREYLPENIGENTVAVMRAIKKALDPRGILNPGKIFS